MNVYLVGGAVREVLRGQAPKDYDFAVEAGSYEEMERELRARGLKVFVSLPKFVTIRGQMPLDAMGTFGGLIVKDRYIGDEDKPFGTRRYVVNADFTLCRKETMYSDGRHPDEVTPCDLLTDLGRRDFTMNAIAVSEEGEYIDPFEGRNAIHEKTIQTVDVAEDRFNEDPLRMLRAIRFAVTTGFWLSPDIGRALSDYRLVERLRELPTERVQDELQRALRHNWIETMWYMIRKYPWVGDVVSEHKKLWFKATMEAR